MMDHRLGDAVRERRVQLQLTQEQLAERLMQLGDHRVRQSDISRIENGQIQVPRIDRMQRLARALEMPTEDLLAAAGWLDSHQGIDGQSDAPLPAPHDGASTLHLVDDRLLRETLQSLETGLERLKDSQTEFERLQHRYEELQQQAEDASASAQERPK